MQIAGKNIPATSFLDQMNNVRKKMGHSPTESTMRYYLSSGLDSKLSD